MERRHRNLTAGLVLVPLVLLMALCLLLNLFAVGKKDIAKLTLLDDTTKKKNSSAVSAPTNAGSTIEVHEKQQSNKPSDSFSYEYSYATKSPSSPPLVNFSTRRAPKRSDTMKQQCFLSSFGNDGVGHQMEAKLSCLAAVLVLNTKSSSTGTWIYVHQPIKHLQHGENPKEMEELFGFSRIIQKLEIPLSYNSSIDLQVHVQPLTNWYNPKTMSTFRREFFLESTCEQTGDTIQQFNKLCLNADNILTTKKKVVLSHDNCWDFFYCQTEQLPREWYSYVVPLLRTSILQGSSFVEVGSIQNASFVPQKTPRFMERCFIVMHIRLGDAGSRKANGQWIQAVWTNLLTAHERITQGKNATLQLAIHSDGTRDAILDLLQIFNENVIVTENYNQSKASNFDDSTMNKTIVSLYCRNEDHATVAAALYDMLTADIFISSDSSFSHSAALLRNPTLDGPTLHPPFARYRERMGTIMGWYFLLLDQNDSSMWLCSNRTPYVQRSYVPFVAQNMSNCPSWIAVNSVFWTNLFNVYFSRTRIFPANSSNVLGSRM